MKNTAPLKSASLAQPSLSVRRLQRSFDCGKTVTPVLRDISLDIFPGELTLIIGPSGSGKSTLLATLGGLLRPDSGDVSVLNARLYSFSPECIDAFRLANCGFIFQGFNLFSALTALEQVMLPLNYFPIGKSEALALARNVLCEVGLEKKMHLRPLELSGGEKQRVAVARALVKRPRLIFADEPTGALDSVNGDMVISLLHQAARARGSTIVAVTHDPRLMDHADRVIRIQDGHIGSDQRQAHKHTKGTQGDQAAQIAQLKPWRVHGGADTPNREPSTMDSGKMREGVRAAEVVMDSDSVIGAESPDHDFTVPRKSRGRWIGWLLACLLLAFTSAAAYYWVTEFESGAAEEMAFGDGFVATYTAMGKGIVDVDGGIVRLAANRDGIIKDIYFEEGDRVKAGEVLAVQDSGEAMVNLLVAEAKLNELQAGLGRLRIQLDAARRNLARHQQLRKNRNVSVQEMDKAEDQVNLLRAEITERKAVVNTARAQVNAAAEEIELRTIRAPMNGQIVRRMTRPGDGASTLSVTPLFLFAPDRPRIIRAEFGESFIGKLKVGMQADIETVVDEETKYSATVLRIGEMFAARRAGIYNAKESADTQVVEVVLLLDDQETGLLLGQRVIVKVNKDDGAESKTAVEGLSDAVSAHEGPRTGGAIE